jgi:glycosyltransferase involved in cell wall biosynthesis
MYNEEPGAENCVDKVCAVLTTLAGDSKLIAVNDGSRDRTGEILDAIAPRFPNLLVVHHTKNKGYGAALQTGVATASQAGFDYTLFMDSDLTNDPRDLPRFVEQMRAGYDVIKATRYSRGGGVSGVPAYRVIISRVGNWIAGFLFRLPLHDCTNGFRAAKTQILARMKLTENRFPIIMEELYWSKYLARTFVEVPVTLTNRDAALRPTSFAYKPSVFWQYLKYPLRAFFGMRPPIESL